MNINNLPTLDETVIAALNFFSQNKAPRLNLKQFEFPIVVGSGNAYNTGLIIFSQQPALITSESNFRATLKSYQKLIKNKTIKQVVIISASGEKDSIWETKLAKKLGLKTTLLTCSPDSSAAQLADRVVSYQKLPEPYTYNVSTYLGLILSATGEDPKKIKAAIQRLRLPKNFNKYQAYSFILPDEFASVAPMLEIKRHELFGPFLSLRAFSFGEARHAKFVNNWEKELVISFAKNKYFGLKKNRWEINLGAKDNNGLIMALCYYLIGLIQKGKKPYYKKNIAQFCRTAPQAYGSNKPFSIIVK